MECAGSLLVLCHTEEQRDRIALFLSAETRPDFEEDDEESECVELFEVAAVPDVVTTPSPTEIYADFDRFDDFNNAEDTAAAVASLSPKAAFLYYYDDEGNACIYRCEGHGLTLITQLDPPYLETDEQEDSAPFDALESLRQIAGRYP